jgi:Zn finger protein HypA/HybF involved in hydrogenase expression
MLILPQEVEIKWAGAITKYYTDKGYKPVPYRSIIKINVLDLSKGSLAKVNIQCDECGEIVPVIWRNYLQRETEEYYCPKCFRSKIRHRDENGKLILEEPIYHNKEWLYNEYIIKDRSGEEISDELKIDLRTIRYWTAKYGFAKEGLLTGIISEDELYDLYINQSLSTTEIGEIYGLCDNSISKLLREYEIDVADQSEAMRKYYYEKGGLEKSIEYANRLENRIIRSCRVRGINVEDFDGFLSDETTLIRGTQDYKKWRQAVFERDNYTCQCCGQRGYKLQAHHIENFSSEIDKRFDIKNGVTMCEHCHGIKYKDSFHNVYGKRNNTKEQLDEYIKNKRQLIKVDIESEESNG